VRLGRGLTQRRRQPADHRAAPAGQGVKRAKGADGMPMRHEKERRLKPGGLFGNGKGTPGEKRVASL